MTILVSLFLNDSQGGWGEGETVREARQIAVTNFREGFGSEAVPTRQLVMVDGQKRLDESMFPSEGRRVLKPSTTQCTRCSSAGTLKHCPSCGHYVCTHCWDWTGRVCLQCEEIVGSD